MKLDFEKGGGLLPAVIQDATDGTILMVGYMSAESLAVTMETGRVTFFSRSKNRLWAKGESSGHWLEVDSVTEDCDGDALLVLARPHGPTCHTGARSCFSESYSFKQAFTFLGELEQVIRERRVSGKESGSYTAELLEDGPKRIAQKVGEEAVELALEAESGSPDKLVAECADLVYHLMVLLESRDASLSDVAKELERRHLGG